MQRTHIVFWWSREKRPHSVALANPELAVILLPVSPVLRSQARTTIPSGGFLFLCFMKQDLTQPDPPASTS